MKSLFLWTTLLFGMMSLNLLISRHVLAASTISEYLLPDASCPAPCWQGLQPGYVQVSHINTVLAVEPVEVSVYLVQWQVTSDVVLDGRREGQFDNAAVVELEIHSRSARLGDILAALGTPDYLLLSQGGYIRPDGAVANRWQLILYYEAEQMKAYLNIECPQMRPALDVPLDHLEFSSRLFVRPLLAVDWHGLRDFSTYYPNPIYSC